MGRVLLCVLLSCVLVACGQGGPSATGPAAATPAPAGPASTAAAGAAPGAPYPSSIVITLPTPTPGPSPTPNALVEEALSEIWMSPIATGADTYLKILSTPSEIVVSTIARTADGGALVAGFVRGTPLGLLLVKVADDGAVVWQRVLSGADSRREQKILYWGDLWASQAAEPTIVPAGDGGAAIAFDDLLVRIDRDGTVISSTVYVPPETDHAILLTSMVPVSGGYLLAGQLWDPHREPPDDLNRGVVLIRTGADGSLMWARRHPGYGVGILYKDSGALPPPISRLVVRADGRPVLGTYRMVPNPWKTHPTWATTQSAVQVVTADVGLTDGSLGPTHELRIMSPKGRTYESPTQQMSAWGLQAMALAPNGDLVLALGMDSGDGFSNLGLWTVLVRMTPSGTVAWAKRLSGGEEPNGRAEVRSIAFDGDDIVLAGSTTEFLSIPVVQRHQNVLLGRVSGAGEVAWVRSIGVTRRIVQDGPGVERGMGVVVGPDGHLVVAGFGDSFSTDGKNDLILIRAAPNGTFSGDAELANLADFGNRHEATWKDARIETSSSASASGMTMPVATETIDLSGTDAGLTDRPVESGCANAKVTLLDGGKTLRSTCSIFVDPAFAGTRTDPDGDGIDQAFEATALALTSPRVEVDEEEDWLEYRVDYDWFDRIKPFREHHNVAIFTRISTWPTRSEARWVIFENAVAWSYDYGGGVTSTPYLTGYDHRGDSEKVFEAWRIVDAHTLRLEWVQTSAHDGNTDHTGTWSVADRSCNVGKIAGISESDTGTQLLCGKILFDDGRVIVQASEDKHATYPDTDICGDVYLVYNVYGENCGWNPSKIPIISWWQWEESDFVGDPKFIGHGVWQFDAYNVGEPDPPYQLINDLGAPATWRGVTEAQRETLTGLFPGESIWDGNLAGESGFCGGLTFADPLNDVQYADKCSGVIGDKFKPDPESSGDQQLFGRLASWYRVSITTGRVTLAPTFSNPTITLVGDGGHRSTFALTGEFIKDKTDVFYLQSSPTYGSGGAFDEPVGPIRSVGLSVSAGLIPLEIPVGTEEWLKEWLKTGWLVTQIDVTVLASGTTWSWTEKAGRWIRPGAPETFVAATEE